MTDTAPSESALPARVAEQAQALVRAVHKAHAYRSLARASMTLQNEPPEEVAALLDGLLSVVATLQQERDGRYRQLRAIQRWFNEQSAELKAVRERETRLREALAEFERLGGPYAGRGLHRG